MLLLSSILCFTFDAKTSFFAIVLVIMDQSKFITTSQKHGTEISRKKYFQNCAMKQMKTKMLNGCVKNILNTFDEENERLKDVLDKLENFNPKVEVQKIQNTLKIIDVIENTFKEFQSDIDFDYLQCSEEVKNFLSTSVDIVDDSEMTNISNKLIYIMAKKQMTMLTEKKNKLLVYIDNLLKINIKDEKNKCKNLISSIGHVEKKMKKVFKSLSSNKTDEEVATTTIESPSILNTITLMDQLIKSINGNYIDITNGENNSAQTSCHLSENSRKRKKSSNEKQKLEVKKRKVVTGLSDLSTCSISQDQGILQDQCKGVIMDNFYGNVYNEGIMDFSCIDDCQDDDEI